MRGGDSEQSEIFSYIPIQAGIRQDHSLRPIRKVVDGVLKKLSSHFY